MPKDRPGHHSLAEDCFLHSLAGVLIIDAKTYTILDANPAAVEMIGTKKEEIVGQVCHRFVCPAEAGSCPIMDLGQEVNNTEKRLLRAGRDPVPILKRAILVKRKGAPVLIESFVDISELKDAEARLNKTVADQEEQISRRTADLSAANLRLKEEVEERRLLAEEIQGSEERFRNLIQYAPEAIILYDMELQRYVEVNANAEKLFGCSREQLLKGGPQQFYLPGQPDGRSHEITVDEHRKRAIAGEEVVFERNIHNGRGEDRIAEVRLVRLPSSRHILIRSSYVDVTDRRKTEDILRHETRLLEILNGIISIANHAEGLPELLDSVLDATLRLMKYSAGGIYLCNPENTIATVAVTRNLPPQFLEEIKTIPTETPPYRALFYEGKPLVTHHYESFAPDRAARYGIASLVSIPLLAHGKVIGAINVSSAERHEVSDEEIDILVSIGKELGGSIGRLEAEEEIVRSAANLVMFFDSVTEMIFILAMDGTVLHINSEVTRKLGYTESELAGKNVLMVHPEERREEAGNIVRGMMEGIVDLCQVPVVAKDGKFIPVETRVSKARWDGKDVLIGVSRDVTERNRAEEQIARDLHEKEALLREIHHRVKNNLQIVTSLLNLQSRTIQDPVVIGALADTQTRVKAMAMVHERLYRSTSISAVDMGDYVNYLYRSLFQFYNVPSRKIQCTVVSPQISVGINTAIPLGLIVNELITNTIKYAFPGDRFGNLRIAITKSGGVLTMEFFDDGAGIPGEIDWKNNPSMGLRLISILVDQLNGTIELDRSAGTRFVINVHEKD